MKKRYLATHPSKKDADGIPLQQVCTKITDEAGDWLIFSDGSKIRYMGEKEL